MSIATKWIIAIIVIAAAVWALWWSGWLTSTPQPGNQSATNATSTTSGQQTVQQQNGMSDASNTSDAALAQDAGAVDTQMQGLSSDSASTDASFSDQPVSQAY